MQAIFNAVVRLWPDIAFAASTCFSLLLQLFAFYVIKHDSLSDVYHNTIVITFVLTYRQQLQEYRIYFTFGIKICALIN